MIESLGIPKAGGMIRNTRPRQALDRLGAGVGMAVWPGRFAAVIRHYATRDPDAVAANAYSASR